MLEKRSKAQIQRIEDDGKIQVFEFTQIYDTETGEMISESKPHARVIEPGDNYADLPDNIKKHFDLEHTPERVKKFKEDKLKRIEKDRLEAVAMGRAIEAAKGPKAIAPADSIIGGRISND